MAFHRNSKSKVLPSWLLLLVFVSLALILLFIKFSGLESVPKPNFLGSRIAKIVAEEETKNYLYWGSRIDCPGKHCESCEGLGHQESSLRCALEEAIYLKRVFVMPSRMCLDPKHNKKGILHHSTNMSSEDRWTENSCAMDSLYDIDLISKTVPVVLDNSKTWYQVSTTIMKLGGRGAAHVHQISRSELRDNVLYSKVLLINRTASPLSWFVECKNRKNHSAITLPYTFLPSMAAAKLRKAAEKIKHNLGDYDAIHVRRGDRVKTRKDRFGVERTLFPHLDRDTRPDAILKRIAKWIPSGRLIFIASDERSPGFFSPLSERYKLAYSSNFSTILDPVVDNNYHLFMIERLVVAGAKTVIRTFKEDDNDLSLTDDSKRGKQWEKPVYTF